MIYIAQLQQKSPEFNKPNKQEANVVFQRGELTEKLSLRDSEDNHTTYVTS